MSENITKKAKSFNAYLYSANYTLPTNESKQKKVFNTEMQL